MAPRGTTPTLGVLPLLAVSWGQEFVFVLCGPSRKSPFLAEVFLCECPDGQPLDLEPPFSVRIRSRMYHGVEIPDVCTEAQFAKHCIDTLGVLPYCWDRLEYELEDLEHFEVVAVDQVSVHALHQEQRANKGTEDALRAAKKANAGFLL